jgi:hypothetical protein
MCIRITDHRGQQTNTWFPKTQLPAILDLLENPGEEL